MAQYSAARLAPEYRRLWNGMEILPRARAQADAAARRVLRGKDTYLQVEKQTGVKWFVVGCIHYRESNCNFKAWLHNGDPMRDRQGRPIRTRQVPKNRPPNPAVDWVAGAYDALVTVEHLDTIKNYGVAEFAYANEKMNGFGYRSPRINIPSPYLWGGSNRQKRGKFVRDGVYDAKVMDTQLGVMVVLRALMDMDSDARFEGDAPDMEHDAEDAPDMEQDDDVPATYSPKATDPTVSEVKPLTKSKTIWGSLMVWLSGIGSAFTGMFEYLATPWGFAIFVTLLTFISVGAFLVIKGRIDIQKVVNHLSTDDTDDETD